MEKSLLMKDSGENSGNVETILDYIISWTIRRASMEFSKEMPILYKYCRSILFNLLGIEDYKEIKVKSVETWKQWNYIDLHANIELEYNGKIKCYAILIENKVYTQVHDNQLIRYRKIFEETYDQSMFELHYVLITCFDEIPEVMINDCKEAGFRCLSLLDLFIKENKEDSESDLFNEFWLRNWW